MSSWYLDSSKEVKLEWWNFPECSCRQRGGLAFKTIRKMSVNKALTHSRYSLRLSDPL